MAKVRYVGFCEESSYGNLESDTTYDFDVASMGLDAPDDPNIVLPTLNRFQTKHIPGYYAPSGGMEYAMDINTIGYFLKFALGGYKFTAGAVPETDPNVHEFWATAGFDLPSFNARVGKDTFEHIFLGCVIDKLSMNIENELVTVKADIFAQKDSKDTLRAELNELDPDMYPLAFYNSGLSINSVNVGEDVKSFGWEYGNGVSIEEGQGLGSRFPYYIKGKSGSNDVSIKLYQDVEDLLEIYWATTDGPNDSEMNSGSGVDYHTLFPVVASFNSGAFGEMSMQFPGCYYKKVPSDLSGSDPIIPELSIGTEAQDVTLNDALTEVFTPVYIKLENFEPEIKAPTAP